MLAIYALGASPEIIEDAYSRHDYLKPAFDSPEPITEKNFNEHLGDERYVLVGFFGSGPNHVVCLGTTMHTFRTSLNISAITR